MLILLILPYILIAIVIIFIYFILEKYFYLYFQKFSLLGSVSWGGVCSINYGHSSKPQSLLRFIDIFFYRKDTKSCGSVTCVLPHIILWQNTSFVALHI
jgi:hypothetical protein